MSGQDCGATVYLRSNNGDASPQTVSIQLPVFEESGAFTGSSGAVTVQATSDFEPRSP